MAFNVEIIGADKIQTTITKMIVDLAHFQDDHGAPMLIVWQTEDMRRKFPNITKESETTVSTKVWPRSRLSEKKKPRGFAKPIRKVMVKPPATGLGKGLRMARPILRRELFIKLCERMSHLMSETLVWKK